MPVPISHSRYSLSSSGTDYRTSSSLSGSLDRSWTSSRAGLSRSTSYVSKYTPTSRTSSVPYFSRTSSSLSEDSGISSRYSASSVNSTSSAVRERSKSREPSIGSYNSSIGSSRSRDSSKSRIVDGGSSTSYNSSLGRHHGSLSSSISSELYKYSPSYYLSNPPLTLRDVGKPPSRPVTTFQSDTDNTFKKSGYSYPRSRRSPLIDSSSESSLPSPSTRSNRSISSAGIGGGYSATSPIERRSRFNNSSSSLGTSSNENLKDDDNDSENNESHQKIETNVDTGEESSDEDDSEGNYSSNEADDILKQSPSPKTNLPSLSTNTDIISSPGRVAGGATATTVRAGSPPSNRLSRSRYHLDTQETSATSGDLKYKIIKEVDEKKITKTKIAWWHGIPKSTLFMILKMREEIVNAVQKEGHNVKAKKLKGVTHVNLEQVMLKWFSQHREQNVPINRPMMQMKADEFSLRGMRPVVIANCFRHAHFVLPVNEETSVYVLPATASAEDPDDPLPVDASSQPGPYTEPTEPQPGSSTSPSSAPLTFARSCDEETWQRLAPDCTYEEYIADDDITV
uniref:HTH CENPB-type domain-containing protein n=1 Tax=Timema douglasi TaxID=61478 RepID=A0A7R8VXM9_TIMDO|nr:unnamed protein product [Timema douglasi]